MTDQPRTTPTPEPAPLMPELLLPEIGGPDPRGQFDRDQVESMLLGINPSRVLEDGKGHAHVSQQDVTAHLIRTFGFGNFDTHLLSLDLVFEHNRTDNNGRPSLRWDVCYRAAMKLTVRNRRGETVAEYENISTATAENQKRGDAHDLAAKSAVSLALKRCTINLGDQFGLSLYNRGQVLPLVRRTLVMPEKPEGAEEETQDLQEGIPRQVALGDHEDDTAAAPPQPSQTPDEGGNAPQGDSEQAPPLPSNWLELATAAEESGDIDLIYDLLRSAATHAMNSEAYHRLRAAWSRVRRGPQ